VPKDKNVIKIINTIPKTVIVRRKRENEWLVIQCHSKFNDDSQSITWLRLENYGKQRKICIDIKWANFAWMDYRRYGYLKCGQKYQVLTGKISPEKTKYEFLLPPGISYFGSAPWYGNEDADRFLKNVCKHNDVCKVRIIGKTKQGREIKCLTIDSGSRKKQKKNILVIAREHANETSGSFAVEAIAKVLLKNKVSVPFLGSYVFHLIPIANPDGVANGTKLPEDKEAGLCDLHSAGLKSKDPTCKAIREEIKSLRPVSFITYHGYLFSVPEVIFYEKQYGMMLLDALIDDNKVSMWYAKRQGPENKTMLRYCYKNFNTTVVLFELPWAGRHPKEIRQMGIKTFLSVMKAHEKRRK